MQATETNAAAGEETARVFFAIWPDATAQQQLAGLAQQLETVCGGRKTRTENIHLTLVFLGEVASERLDALQLAVKDIKAQAFDFAVEEIRYWKHNRIAYAGTSRPPPQLLHLVSALQNNLAAAGFAFDRQTLYMPHITLLRKAACHTLPELAEPIVWPVREWMLVKSAQVNGRSAYLPLGRWPLA